MADISFTKEEMIRYRARLRGQGKRKNMKRKFVSIRRETLNGGWGRDQYKTTCKLALNERKDKKIIGSAVFKFPDGTMYKRDVGRYVGKRDVTDCHSPGYSRDYVYPDRLFVLIDHLGLEFDVDIEELMIDPSTVTWIEDGRAK